MSENARKNPDAQGRPVVFDLDGTLIDSRGDITASCNFALRHAGRAELSSAEISGFVGDGARALVSRAFRLPESASELNEHLSVFLDYYTANPATFTKLFAGAADALASLDGRQLALCTSKARRTTDAVLLALGLDGTFASVVGGGDTEAKKPAPDPLLRVARELAVEPHSLIMVGDSAQDILAARAVGAHAIGVKGGFLPLERLARSGPDVILDDLSELVPYLERRKI